MRRGWLVGGHGTPVAPTVRFDIYGVHPPKGTTPKFKRGQWTLIWAENDIETIAAVHS
jgi:hypothetical protein